MFLPFLFFYLPNLQKKHTLASRGSTHSLFLHSPSLSLFLHSLSTPSQVKPELANVSKLAQAADVSLARAGFTSDCEAALNEQIK